jgi:LEA14-like dessication related protein
MIKLWANPTFNSSHALRGNSSGDALRPVMQKVTGRIPNNSILPFPKLTLIITMRLILFFFMLFTLNGCSTSVAKSPLAVLMPVAPQVSLKNFSLLKMGLSEQTYRLRLSIKNPNAFPLPIQSLNYQLFLNNKSFAKGRNTQPITIPAVGEGYMETDITSNIADVIQGWQQWFSLAKRSLDYRLTGDVGVSSFAIPIPFQYADKVDLLLIH